MTAANDDCTLYERWLENRDGDAFAEISRRHAPVVYDLAVRYSGDASLAEDLVQEALLDLALAGTRKPIEIGLIAWMARFAMCRARNLRSSERSRRKRQQIVGGRRPEDVMPDDHLERDEELQHALSRAEPGERVVLAMRYLHGWDYGRIASALTISEGAARVRVHRALGTLRSRLGVAPVAATNGRSGKNGTTNGKRNGRVNGTNGATKHSSPLVGLVAAQALHRMPDGLLELGTQNAIDAAAAASTAATAGHFGSHAAPRVGRLTLQALGLSSAFVLATAVSLTAYEPGETLTAELPSFATLFDPAPAGGSDGVRTDGQADSRWRGSVPRPPEWDNGVLKRLSRESGDRTSDAPTEAPAEPSVAAGPAPAPAPPIADGAPERPVEVPRPISRDARAATRVSVSSEDERAGSSGGGSMTFSTRSTAASAVPRVDVQPGLPANLTDPNPTLTPRRADRLVGTTPLRDLPPAQAELVAEAAALVLRVVAADGVDAQGFTADRRQLQKQARRLKQQYRTTRKRLRKAALAADADAIAYEAGIAAKVRTAQHVLRLLVDVVLADGREAGDLVWPEGADVTAALADVVGVLGTLLPDGALAPEDTDLHDVTGLLPDGALPDGLTGDE